MNESAKLLNLKEKSFPSHPWHTVDPLELGDVARDLWRDERLRAVPPEAAALEWLKL
jgi:hypothetical protein